MIKTTAINLLLRVGVTGAFLNLNKSPDVPGDGLFPDQGRQGAP
jgi:hypothetical protein